MNSVRFKGFKRWICGWKGHNFRFERLLPFKPGPIVDIRRSSVKLEKCVRCGETWTVFDLRMKPMFFDRVGGE